jgi:hypothetical protein
LEEIGNGREEAAPDGCPGAKLVSYLEVLSLIGTDLAIHQ